MFSWIRVFTIRAKALHFISFSLVLQMMEKESSDVFLSIVRKGFRPPPPLFFKALTPWPSCSPFLKTLFTLPSFLFHLLLRYFRQFPPLSRNPLQPSSDQPTFLDLRKYQKGGFNNSTVAFYQKSIFNILNAFTNRLS